MLISLGIGIIMPVIVRFTALIGDVCFLIIQIQIQASVFGGRVRKIPGFFDGKCNGIVVFRDLHVRAICHNNDCVHERFPGRCVTDAVRCGKQHDQTCGSVAYAPDNTRGAAVPDGCPA